MKKFLLAPLLAVSILAEPHPDLRGTVSDPGGAPVANATVFVYTAGPKVGSSSFCPSCYPDCRKKARTDAKGEFFIESLDPTLIFRLLVVGAGKLPEFVSGVDPSNGVRAIKIKPIDPAVLKSATRMAGVVIDQDGRPVAGAVLDVHGVSLSSGVTRWGGVAQSSDPVAVTDEQGRFLIDCKPDVSGVHAQIDAAGQAKRWFTLTPGRDHLVLMDRGVTVTGQVLRDGKPILGAAVAMVTTERESGVGMSGFETMTDGDGNFIIQNVPARNTYYLFTKMDAVPGGGLLPLQHVQTAGADSVHKTGSLSLAPGYTIHGQVHLTDGKPLPEKTHILLGREDAWDSSDTILDERGQFTFKNVPAESVGLHVRVKGYKPSKENPSLDWLNARILGKVEADLPDFHILLQPGEWRLNHEDDDLPAGRERYPAHLPLRSAKFTDPSAAL